ncbi:hypothetical protein ACHAXS_003964 [Conticribra weissflogii]
MLSFLVMLACAPIAILALELLRRYLRWKFTPLRTLPGPKSTFFTGVFSQIEKEPFMQPYQRWWDAAGVDTPLLHYTGIMGRSFVAVLDADAIKLILTSSASAEHPRYTKGFFYLKNVIGNGLVTLEGSDWHRHRRIIQPSFNTYHLKESLNSCVPGLVQRVIACWKERPNADIDVSGHFSALTLDIIGKVAFSHDFHSLSSIEAWSKEGTNEIELHDELIKSLYESLSPSTTRMLLINFGLSGLIRFFLPALHQTQVLLDKAVDSVVQKAHERYRADGLQRNGPSPSSDVKCLLELLFDAKDLESSSNRTLTHKELQGSVYPDDSLFYFYDDFFSLYHAFLRENISQPRLRHSSSPVTRQQQLFAIGRFIV